MDVLMRDVIFYIKTAAVISKIIKISQIIRIILTKKNLTLRLK